LFYTSQGLILAGLRELEIIAGIGSFSGRANASRD
jgi:hypothetical protein